MKIKKIGLLLLAFALLLSLCAFAGCGEDDSPEDTKTVAGSVQLPENGDVIP